MTDKEKLKTFIERIINICDSYIEDNPDTINIGIAISKKNVCKQILQFINSLQSEVTEKNDKGWSEEDERMFHVIIADFKGFKHENTSTLEPHFDECIKWLESLKQRMNYNTSMH